MEFEKYRDKIETICISFGVSRLEVFGSVLRDDFSPDSDIDFFYELSGTDNLFLRFMGLKSSLESLFERKIDLVREDNIINPYILENIKKSKRKIIYAA